MEADANDVEAVADRTGKSVGKEGEKYNPEDRCDYYLVGSYVVAMFQGAWYVGQILVKNKEKSALPAEDYIFISFMQQVVKDIDHFKWLDRVDKLKERISFLPAACPSVKGCFI